jgi:hypothetical protein
MRGKTFLAQAAVVLALSGTLVPAAAARNLSLSLNGGVSQPFGLEYNDYSTGFAVGANGMLWLWEQIGIGGRIGYSRWGADEDVWLDRVESLISGSVDGSTSILEFIPAGRIRTVFEDSPVNLFGQFGFGLYLISQSAELTGTLSNGTAIQGDLTGTDWRARWGFSVGPGISLGLGSESILSVEILPLYNIVFDSGDAFNYFTGNVGISLNF